jgi:hypothetical protein
MPRPRAVFTVDEQLLWLVTLPEALAGATRAATPASLAALGAELDALESELAGPAGGRLAGVVTAALMQWLQELPELPFIGEPFGGAEGTD